MGTHGRGGFKKLVLGSTTEQVLRRTEWPVLALRAGGASAHTDERAGNQIKGILVAADSRESAMPAMQWAAALASDINVPLVLAHVVAPVIMPASCQALVADFEVDRVAAGHRQLATLAPSFRDIRNQCVVSVGPRAESIASLAAKHQAGLIVMGLAGSGDSDERRPGSMAFRVLRMAHVAGAVIPAPAAQAAYEWAS
jgi:nucleotide-binding universal stress UspA family protein